MCRAGRSGRAYREDMVKRLTLTLDYLDYQTVIETIADRERAMPLPDGTSDINGKVIAEICRGYRELLDHSLKELL